MNCQKCNKESRWVDNGPRLQYWYCGDCKIEVVPVKRTSQPSDYFDPKRDRSVAMWKPDFGD
jgi:hypothetical protein